MARPAPGGDSQVGIDAAPSAVRDRRALRLTFIDSVETFEFSVDPYDAESNLDFLRNTKEIQDAPRLEPLQRPDVLTDPIKSALDHAEAVQLALRLHHELSGETPDGSIVIWHQECTDILIQSLRMKAQLFTNSHLKRLLR